MQIRPMTTADLDRLADIDATVESADYLHLERQGDGLTTTWRVEPRPLRQKRIASNPVADDDRFLLKQVVSGADEGIVLAAEHDNLLVGSMLARPDPARGTLRLIDVRVDYDYRRQGIGSAMVYQLILQARELQQRAVTAQARSNNHPANAFLAKCGFELAGVNTHKFSNHDLVKEEITLYWYAALD